MMVFLENNRYIFAPESNQFLSRNSTILSTVGAVCDRAFFAMRKNIGFSRKRAVTDRAYS